MLYATSAAGVALAVRAVVVEPPPLWVAGIALGAYLAMLILGVTFSRFSMFADVVTRGGDDARGVALTFDDGPDPKSTPKVLDLLDAAGAKATFFVIGHKVTDHPELTAEIAARGHALGIHSYAHERLFSLRPPWQVKRDLERALNAVEHATGERPVLFRAPIGHISPAMAGVARDLGLITVGWTARGVDGWSGAKPDKVARNVCAHLRDGAILLLHDAAEKGDFVPASVEALPAIVEAAENQNLTLVRVDDWLAAEATEEATA